jgi:Ser/Thr protein kinase RdoA (MazF antagonist)
MALFEQTIPIPQETISVLVLNHWDIVVDKIIKASQNHTFAAHAASDPTHLFAVRVTPDPHHKHLDRIEREIKFVDYIKREGKVEYVCGPVATNQGEWIVQERELIVVVYEWANGRPVNFMEYSWMTNHEFVYSWGCWLGKFHEASRKFMLQHKDIASGIQTYAQVHECILQNAPIHELDKIVMEQEEHYGVLHGDLNTSNFFFVDEERKLSVFDWDQSQLGWYLMDIAQAEFGVYMLAEAGSMIDGSKVEEANPKRFEDWMVEGYESVRGSGSVDRDRLSRMVSLRMYFYNTFCRTAKAQGEIPKDMEWFIDYIIRWFDKKQTKP